MRRIDWRDPANRAKLKQLREEAGVPPYEYTPHTITEETEDGKAPTTT